MPRGDRTPADRRGQGSGSSEVQGRAPHAPPGPPGDSRTAPPDPAPPDVTTARRSSGDRRRSFGTSPFWATQRRDLGWPGYSDARREDPAGGSNGPARRPDRQARGRQPGPRPGAFHQDGGRPARDAGAVIAGAAV